MKNTEDRLLEIVFVAVGFAVVFSVFYIVWRFFWRTTFAFMDIYHRKPEIVLPFFFLAVIAWWGLREGFLAWERRHKNPN